VDHWQIVQVPVGTVVHLVTGSLPCLEQKPSVLPDQSSWEPWRLSSPSDVGPGATVADETQISSAAWLESLCLDSGRRRIIKSAYGTDAVEEQGLREQEEGSSDGSIILETAHESEGCVEDADLLEDPDFDSIGSKEDLECPGDVGAEKINFSGIFHALEFILLCKLWSDHSSAFQKKNWKLVQESWEVRFHLSTCVLCSRIPCFLPFHHTGM